MVVETIDFYEDEEAELPAPLTLADVKALNKAAPFGEEEAAGEEGADEEGKPAEVGLLQKQDLHEAVAKLVHQQIKPTYHSEMV